jgi:hypothetical protein
MLAVGLSLAAVAACDPCFGVSNCGGDPRIAIEGTLVELANDSMSTLTGTDGRWQVSAAAREVGDVIVDINVSARNVATYRVRGVHVSATDRSGDGLVLPTWVVDPYFAFAAELYYRATQDTRVEGATVEFHRTGGINYTLGSSAAFFVGKSDVAGRLALFDVFAHASSLGELIGDLVVHLPPPLAPDTVHALHLGATQILHAETQIIRLGIGPSVNPVSTSLTRADGGPANR